MFEIGYKEIYFKSAILPTLCKGRWFFARKTGGIDFDEELTFIKQPVLQANLQPNIIYKQSISNLSVSYADSSLYQREPVLQFVIDACL